MVKKKIRLSDVFLGLQEQMINKLSLNRRVLSHPVAKGTASELEWIDMLSTYLPSRYGVEQAFMIDHTGSISEQIDIVILDRLYTPFLFKQNGQMFIPIESVYAVFEIKQQLKIENIEYASQKAKSVRSLKRTSARIVERGELRPPRIPPYIYAGLLTLDGKITSATVKKIRSLKKDRALDMGCSLLNGSFFCDRDKKTTSIGNSDTSLVSFFLRLFKCLQKEGTVASMEIDKYFNLMKNTTERKNK